MYHGNEPFQKRKSLTRFGRGFGNLSKNGSLPGLTNKGTRATENGNFIAFCLYLFIFSCVCVCGVGVGTESPNGEANSPKRPK